MRRLHASKLYGLIKTAEGIMACTRSERRLKRRRSCWKGEFEDGTGTNFLIREDKLTSVTTFMKKNKGRITNFMELSSS
jgi:hypothetical protein